MNRKILILFAILITFSSCKIIFTQELREQVEEQKIDVEQIQFYTSHTIILQRVASSSIIIEDTAKLRQTQQIEIDRIKIRRNTPGMCINKFNEELELVFEQKDSCSLKFVLSDTSDIYSGKYKIGALRWENEVGIIPYDNEIYYLQPQNNFFQPKCKESSLKVKRRFLYKWNIQNRRLKGVKVNNE